MDIRHMKVLEAVYRTGSVTAAARIIHVSQPAISKTIRQIEEVAGLTLFDNRNGRLVATSHLHALMPQIDRTLLDYSKVRGRIDELRSGRKGLVRIASVPTLVVTMVAEAVKRVRAVEPQAEFKIEVASMHNIMDKVLNDEADLGICQPVYSDPTLNAQPISHNQVVCVMRNDHVLARQSFVTVADLADQDIISYSAAEPTAAKIFEIFSEQQITIRRVIEVDFTIGACSLVNEGLGVGLLTSFDVERYFQDLCVRPLRPEIHIGVSLLTSKVRILSFLAESFRGKLIEVGLASSDHSA